MKFIKGLIIVILVLSQCLGQPRSAFATSLTNQISTFNSAPIFISAQISSSLKQASGENDWEPPEGEVDENFISWLLGLGRRGPCSDLNPPLVALVPTLSSSYNNSSVTIDGINLELARQGIALTFSSHPSFWFHIPNQAHATEQVEFMLQDDRGEDVLNKPIKARLKTGLVNIKLPESLASLKLNQPYHWFFSMVCDVQRPSRNPHVDGWIRRVDPIALDLDIEALNLLLPKDRLNKYSRFNIWHETVELLAEENCFSSQSSLFTEYWDILLDNILPGVGRNWIDPLSYCASPEPLEIIASTS